MRRIAFSERLKENVRVSRVYLACVFMIAMLTGAYATGDTKQTSSEIPLPPSFAELSASTANETGQISAKGESENGVTSDDYELECCTRKWTGSRLKRKGCVPKAEWAEFDKKFKTESERFVRDITQESRKNPHPEDLGIGPFGGPSGMPRPR